MILTVLLLGPMPMIGTTGRSTAKEMLDLCPMVLDAGSKGSSSPVVAIIEEASWDK